MIALKTKFRRWQKEHRNFVTPHIVKVIQHGRILIEISEGRSMDNKELYGVSPFEYAGGKEFVLIDRGDTYPSREQAEKYAKKLRDML